MPRTPDPLANAQNDLFERIRHRRGIADNSIDVQQMRPRTEEDATAIKNGINTTLAGTSNLSGGPLAGLAILVPLPSFKITEPNLPSLFGEIVLSVVVLENILINGGQDGTGITCEQAAVEVMKAGHLAMIADNRALTCDGMSPVDVDPQEYMADIACEVVFRARAGMAPSASCSQPLIEVDGSAFTVTCATAGATIYATTDNTYPAPSNPNAFTVPHNVENDGTDLSGLPLRAVAYHPDLNPSLPAFITL